MFHHIVAEGIRHALPPFDMEEFHLPEYEMNYEDYSEMSVIAARQKGERGQSERRLVFHSLDGVSFPTRISIGGRSTREDRSTS